jgi:trehalose 6-phosphate phosphatase
LGLTAVAPLPVPLPVPLTQAGTHGLRAILASAPRALLAVDFDGTLSPIVDDPAAARPQLGAPDVLRRSTGVFGTVAVVTGRPAEVAAALLGFVADPPAANLLVIGHYGLETWTASTGVVQVAPVDAGKIDEVRSALPGLLRDTGAPDGTTIEDKGASIAVHVRRTADPVAAMEALVRPLSALALSHRLRLEPGRLVLELRPPGVDKGWALEELVRTREVAAVSYFGDDLGDLAAFDAVERLRTLGVPGLLVCSGSAEVGEVAARADLVVDGPRGVVDLIGALVEAAGAEIPDQPPSPA